MSIIGRGSGLESAPPPQSGSIPKQVRITWLCASSCCYPEEKQRERERRDRGAA